MGAGAASGLSGKGLPDVLGAEPGTDPSRAPRLLHGIGFTSGCMAAAMQAAEPMHGSNIVSEVPEIVGFVLIASISSTAWKQYQVGVGSKLVRTALESRLQSRSAPLLCGSCRQGIWS